MKKIIIGFVSIFILLVGAILVVPGFIDWSQYRTEIAQKVKQTIDRDLIIGGDIRFSILPSPVLEVTDIRLSNASTGLNADMVQMRRLDVQVALFPLLTGTLQVQSIRLIEPEIHLEILTNGRGNWDFSAQNSAQGQASRPALDNTFSEVQSQNDSAQLPLQVDQFIIEKGNLYFIDQTSGQEENLKDINARFSLAGLSGPFEAGGTFAYKNIPLGFEATVGQIVNNRSASFAAQLKTAHGKSETRISGTFINQPEGPRITAKINSKGSSFAGLLNAVMDEGQIPGALDRAFQIDTDIIYQPERVALGDTGLDFRLGEDHINVQATANLGPSPEIVLNTRVKTINGDLWLDQNSYRAPTLEPLPLVIELSNLPDVNRGNRVSTTLDAPVKAPASASASPSAPAIPEIEETEPIEIPSNLSAQVSLDVDALLLKGDSIRQIRANISLEGGEIALERMSAILPGAGDLSIIGVGGTSENGFSFDGSLDLNFALVRNALKWLDVDVGHLPNDRLQQLNLSSEIAANVKTVSLQNFTVNMDASQLQGQLGVALNEVPKVFANLTLDRINLDAYAPHHKATSAEPEPQNTSPAPSQQPSAQTTAPQNSTQTLPQPVENQPPSLPVDLFKKLNADLSFKIVNLRYQGQDVQDIALRTVLNDGALRLDGTRIRDLAGLQFSLGGAMKEQDGSILFEALQANVQGNSVERALGLAQITNVLNARRLGAINLTAQLDGPLLKPQYALGIGLEHGTISSNGQLDLFPLPRVAAQLNLDLPKLSNLIPAFAQSYQPRGQVDLKSQINLTGNPQNLSIINLNGSFNGAPFSGSLNAEIADLPKINATLKTGRLNITPLLPQGAQKAAAQPQPQKPLAASQSNSAAAPSQASPANASRWSTEPIDVSGLEAIDATLALKSEAIQFENIVANAIDTNVSLQNGVLNVDQKIANLFGGPVELKSTVQSKPSLSVQTDLKTGSLDVAQATQQLTGEQYAQGRMNLTSALSSQGQSELSLVQNLNGQITANMTKVSASSGKNSSMLRLLNLLATLSGRDPSKGLADVAINSNVQNGVANLSSASLTSSIANGSATGQVDLPNWNINVDGTLKVAQNALVGLIAQQTKMKSDYPFSIKGSIDNPAVKLDAGSFDSGQGLVIPIPEQLDRKGVGNLLRGVLGGAGIDSTPSPSNDTPNPTPQNDNGTIAPPPPPPGGQGSSQPQQMSPEELLIRGLGTILQNR